MSKKLFIKFLDVIPTAIGISLIAFLLIRLIPGDPVMLLLGERGSDPIVYEKMKASLGLDLPWYEQYWSFITKAFSSDDGWPVRWRRRLFGGRRYGRPGLVRGGRGRALPF